MREKRYLDQMKSKRVYVDKDRDKSLTIKLSVGHYLEATFNIDELEKILVAKLYGGKFEV